MLAEANEPLVDCAVRLPHCDDAGAWGEANGKPRYRCADCRWAFSPLTGTPLAGLRHRGRWRDQA